jgi:hypothetical protein
LGRATHITAQFRARRSQDDPELPRATKPTRGTDSRASRRRRGVLGVAILPLSAGAAYLFRARWHFGQQRLHGGHQKYFPFWGDRFCLAKGASPPHSWTDVRRRGIVGLITFRKFGDVCSAPDLRRRTFDYVPVAPTLQRPAMRQCALDGVPSTPASVYRLGVGASAAELPQPPFGGGPLTTDLRRRPFGGIPAATSRSRTSLRWRPFIAGPPATSLRRWSFSVGPSAADYWLEPAKQRMQSA